MHIPEHQLKPLIRRRPKAGGRKADPSGDLATARALGFNPSTWRARMRKVRAGLMTMEEAMQTPVMGRDEYSRLGGRKKRTG